MGERVRVERIVRNSWTKQEKYSMMRKLIKNFSNREAIRKDQNKEFDGYQFTQIDYIAGYHDICIAMIFNWEDNTYLFTISYPQLPFHVQCQKESERWYEPVLKTEPDEIDYGKGLDILNFLLELYHSENC